MLIDQRTRSIVKITPKIKLGSALYAPETNAEKTIYYFYTGKKANHYPQHFNCRCSTAAYRNLL